ncbi:MAG: hypothetical protein RJB13_2455 [Pseudomonadota bacterium]
MLISLKLIDQLFLKLPLQTGKSASAPCWEKWNISLFSEIFTRQGFEVESTILRGAGLGQVVVGKIITAEKHPKADKLKICKVQISASETRQIVCGARNARPDLHVAVALPSVALPNGIIIKPSTIRDIESYGMLCSREELGLPLDESRDGDGIWELNHEPSGGIDSLEQLNQLIGTPVFQALAMDDVLLELNVTPNRPDLLSHEGAARELCAGLAWAGMTDFSWLNGGRRWNKKCSPDSIAADADRSSKITTQLGTFTAQNSLSVPAFFVGLENVIVTTTPPWLRSALEALGQKSVNSVVDACNLVLLCFAQPNHAFDLSKLAPSPDKTRKLSLRFARQNEKFLGLDAKERILQQSDCVVSDGESAQALLGVIGGDQSKVDASTNTVILEFANPHPVLVRRTSRRHGRKTDSSFAFEKGIDVFERFAAASMLIGLLEELQSSSGQLIKYAGSVFAQSDSEISPLAKTFFNEDRSGREPVLSRPIENYTIDYNSGDVVQRVGAELISFEKQLSLLESLGFTVQPTGTASTVKVLVPSWRRLDVSGAADLVEEIVRVVGIDHVPSQPLAAPTQLSRDDSHLFLFEKVSERLVMLGYHETAGFHFMRADDWRSLGQPSICSFGEPIALLNPIIKDEPIMQTTLISGLLRKVAYNLNYGTRRGQIFELSRTFQNADQSGRRVFEDNGCGVGLEKELSSPLSGNLEDYSPSHSLQLSSEETAHLRPGETPRVAGVVFGPAEEKEWSNGGERLWSFHSLAAHVAEILSVFSCNIEIDALPTHHPVVSSTHPGRSAAVYAVNSLGKTLVGWVGQFHPAVMRNFGIETDCLGFELNLSLCCKKLAEAQEEKSPVRRTNAGGAVETRLPSVERDFAFLVAEEVTAARLIASVESSIREVAIEQKKIPARLISARVFDVYRGQGVAAGFKSVALRVVLLPTERTLTDADIGYVSSAVIERVVAQCSALLRG